MEVITTMQKDYLIKVGANKQLLVKSTFLRVGPPGVPPTTIINFIINSSYRTKGEIQGIETTNLCMQTCHQTMTGESYLMGDLWQLENDSIGMSMGDKDSLI